MYPHKQAQLISFLINPLLIWIFLSSPSCFFFFIFGYSGSSLLRACFLQLQQAYSFLVAVASLVAEHRLQAHGFQQLQHLASVVAAQALQSTGSVVVAHGLSCSMSCGISLDQGWNPCPLHWQADSYPLYHQGSPQLLFHKSAKVFQWTKDCLVNKWCWSN